MHTNWTKGEVKRIVTWHARKSIELPSIFTFEAACIFAGRVSHATASRVQLVTIYPLTWDRGNSQRIPCMILFPHCWKASIKGQGAVRDPALSGLEELPGRDQDSKDVPPVPVRGIDCKWLCLLTASTFGAVLMGKQNDTHMWRHCLFGGKPMYTIYIYIQQKTSIHKTVCSHEWRKRRALSSLHRRPQGTLF